jgi:1-acyl-sn-glycerol-3-phosphate acyltransferase
LARTLVRVFFRSLEVAGGDHVPASGPVVEVANHQNGLVDGLVLIAAGRRYPRFLGKSTLWKIPPLRPFLTLAGVVPVYRGADTVGVLSDGERAEHNRTALARSGRLLAEGGVIGVFPEGVSHDEASLQDLRSGAARLALDAASAGVPGVVVLPVGIVYDDKARFRSRVLVRFGPPRPVDGRIGSYRADPRAAVRELTSSIADDLRAVGPDYESVAQAERFARLAVLVSPPGGEAGAGAAGLAEQDRIARGLAAAAADPAARAEVERIERLATRYEAGLALYGLDDAARRVGLRVGRRAPRYALGPVAGVLAVPVAGFGVAVHALPYAVIKVLGGIPANRGMRGTVKLLGSFGLYNLTYLGLASLVGRRRGWAAGLVTLVGAPLSGWVALRILEEADDVGLAQRAVATVARRRVSAARLEGQRQRLTAAVGELTARARPQAPAG